MTHSFALLLLPARAAQPRAAAAASEEALPPVVRMRFPPGSLRVARGLSEDEDELEPPAARRGAVAGAPVSAPGAAPGARRGGAGSGGSDGSGGSRGRRAPRRERSRSRGRRRGEGDRDRGAGRQRSRGRRRAAAPGSGGSEPAGAAEAAAAAAAQDAARGLAASMRARALVYSGSVRASQRSPHAQALKRQLHDARALFASASLDLVAAAAASLLSLAVPLRCGGDACSLPQQLAWAALTPLHRAVLVINFITLAGFLITEAVFAKRELWLITHCDEDRAAPWAALAAQLSAYPALARALDAANASAVQAAVALAALLAGNVAATAALAATQQYAGFRTALLLALLPLPAARRLAAFGSVAREAHAQRLALPLSSRGRLSLNCLDEAFTRTGEDAAV